MARLGIDYGTTNTVVVCSDRGRYPVVPHTAQTAVGPVARESFASLVAHDRETGELLYGAEAERCLYRPGAGGRFVVIRSLKRLLRDYVEGARAPAAAGEPGLDVAAMLRGFAGALRDSVLRSGLLPEGEPLEAVLTWPANANGAQRFITRRSFQEAGFVVTDTLGEPAAAAVEFADRMARGDRAASRKLAMNVAVFDLGGGTFDVSLVKVAGSEFNVIASRGIERLGGDDFDEVLAGLFSRRMGIQPGEMAPFQRSLFMAAVRQQKESISSGTVRTLILSPEDFGLRGPVCAVPVAAYFEALRELLAPAVDQMADLVGSPAARAAGIADETLSGIYLVGGSSLLPLVPALIAERFPGVRRILSDKPFSATAMGAAIHSTETVRLRDVLSRHFGVLRLAERGTKEYFSFIFPAGTRLPSRGDAPVERRIEYAPHHNIGHLRYLECAALDAGGLPSAGVRRWSDAFFPYDPAIPVDAAVDAAQIAGRPELGATRVAESYRCDADGVITARITRGVDGATRVYEVFRT